MRILLDTHIFLWYIRGDVRLPTWMKDAIRDANNDVFLSVASLWEIIVKHQLGRLSFPQSPQTYLPQQRERHGIASLPIQEASVAQLSTLPLLHRDPFDRILIAQALEHNLQLATVDAAIQAYPVPRLAPP